MMVNKNLARKATFLLVVFCFAAIALMAGKPVSRPFSVLVATDTTNYYPGDTVLVTANAGNGTFSYSYDLPAGSEAGTWTIDVAIQDTTRIDLPGMGYSLKDTEAVVCCTQCHTRKSNKGYDRMHGRHVSSGQWDCSWCHNFSRPERNLTMPN